MPFPDDSTHIGGYRALRLLGAGGMGKVYACLDEALHREVAIKVLLPELNRDKEMVERFMREGRAMARVSSPHVATIFQIGEENGAPFIVMELLNGKDLAQILQRGALDVARAVGFARQTLGGLKAAAAAGLVHRDIKPANLLIVNESVKITDFGLARPLDGSQNLTATGLVVGSPHYLAPELARGQNATHASDIYALGCTLFEMLAGAPPYQAKTPIEVITAHIKEPVPDLRGLRPDVPPALVSLVAQMMAKAALDRPTDFDAIDDALARSIGLAALPRFTSGAGPVVNPAGPPASPPASAPSSPPVTDARPATEIMFGSEVKSEASIPWAATGDILPFDTEKGPTLEVAESHDTESNEAPVAPPVASAAPAPPTTTTASAAAPEPPLADRSLKVSVKGGEAEPAHDTVVDTPRAEASGGLKDRLAVLAQKRVLIAAAASAVVGIALVALLSRGGGGAVDARVARIDKGEAEVVLEEIEAIPQAKRSPEDVLVRGHALAKLERDDDAIVAVGDAAKAGVVDARARDYLFEMMDDERADDIVAIFKGWPDPTIDADLARLALDGKWWPRHHALTALEARGHADLIDRQAFAILDFTTGETCNKRRYGLNLLKKVGRDATALKAIADANLDAPEFDCISDRELDAATDEIGARLEANKGK